MPEKHQPSSASSGAQMGWAATSTMLGGLFVWGGAGWLLDHWWGTRFATPIGAVLGIALGVVAVVLRYGRPTQPSGSGPESTDGHI